MPKKKTKKIDNNEISEYNTDEDIILEEDLVGVSGTIKKIQKKLKECEKERQEYLNGWQRARADSVNKDREAQKERAQTISRAKTEVFMELFPILDSFDMAFSHKEAWERVDKKWRVGIEHIHAQAIQIFLHAGITTIDTVKEFDPHIHEPVETKEVEDEKDDNRVLTIVQKGYCKGDQVLRPAKVIIGKYI